MFLVGLTGGVGTGKTTVGRMFTRLFGVPVVDADLLARQVVAPGSRAWRKIKEEFGEGVLMKDGSNEIDRAALRNLIFEDRELRKRLNAITHPEIYRLMCWEVAKSALRGHQYVVLDIPLLYEADIMVNWMHKVVVVTCEEDLQMQRLMEQRGLSERESRLMIEAQMPLEDKARRANFVVENSASLQDTEEQVIAIHSALSSSRFHWKVRFAVAAAVGSVVALVCLAVKGRRRH